MATASNSLARGPATIHRFDAADSADPFRLERRMALLLILVTAWYLRAMNAGYSSAYMDESVYVLYGRMFLSRHFEAPIDQPLQWSFGWYLWPMLAALADKLGGIAAVRELSALLGTLTVASVYGFARRVFSPAVGLASAAVFAMLAPAIYASRIATRDSGAIFFFALGLWAFACAWQEDKAWRWLGAAACLFAAFLCKYVAALFFPVLVLLALGKKLRPFVFFTLPLTLLCAGYAGIYWNDLAALLRYSAAYESLRAPATEAQNIYIWNRLDLWALVLLSGFSLLGKTRKARLFLVGFGAALFLLFQWKTRADYDYWKHAVYPLLFLTPLAVEGMLAVVARIFNKNLERRVMASALSVLLLGGLVGWLGNSWNMERFVFWPNVEPALAYMEGRVSPDGRVLADDSVYRYYLHPRLSQRQIVDPFYFSYEGLTGPAAYAAAVQNGAFEYVLLDGGVGGDAERMQSTIRPALPAHYTLRFNMPDPQLGHELQVYARTDIPELVPAQSATGVHIDSPVSGSVVHTDGIVGSLQGTTHGASHGWRVHIEVFTNRWYLQPDVELKPDGSFTDRIYLGGEGDSQCHQMVRARLYDDSGTLRASDVVFNLVRANPNGTSPRCK